ncbi:mediator complex subunit Med5-domain-containing protein [Desarmillaria tabescens]|uniref:Mediator of RNA polymerase II transcription subunit 5 n=1 Tax=Armillaria tabescens TaxID=1929756 RepID=A0AA39TSJ6_ARMTA|nr:mediator complex subunit Med5-domain-containing protein [Desarmillaria tabescens]KAK0465088.1 mediator complex subunit Med5-domain-containing protein [Desarmillaria tabescens]
MSLAELTRNCFQSGISASKWLGLCRLLIAKDNGLQESDAVESTLSNSVLSMLRFYPGNPDLQEYLKYAIQDGMISVAVFVATMLQAARSPVLHHPATLDMLCRIALDAHYSSGSPPMGSVVSYGESAIIMVGTVQDALALLRTAHALPLTHFHQLTASASELVILLLSCACVSDLSQVSTAQASIQLQDITEILQSFRLTPAVRQALDTYMVSLGFLTGDESKAAREAQMMHSLQVALGKDDVSGPNSDTDVITFGLELHHLVTHRARHFGAGCGPDAVALLVGIFRRSSWPAPVFYTQLFTAALLCLSQASQSTCFIWRGFIVGRLPALLTAFEEAMTNDNTVDVDWRSATQAAMSIFHRQDILVRCDHVLASAEGTDSFPPNLPFSRELLRQLVDTGLLDDRNALGVDPTVLEKSLLPLHAEAQNTGFDIRSYIDCKLTPDLTIEEAHTLFDRICKEAASHSAFSIVIMKRFILLATSFDVEALSRLCKALYLRHRILDIISLHVKIDELLYYTISLVDSYDCETIGDPQTAVSHLGDIVMFSQYTLAHFNLDAKMFVQGDRTVSGLFLQSASQVFFHESLSGEDAQAFNAWFKTLFDSGSEGIEDTILRSSRPKTLLKIASTLFSSAINARIETKIDSDTLNNGISFFTGPLLSWTLVGVVKSLLQEIYRKGFMAPMHIEVLQTLLLSPSCPKPVLVLCGSRILTLLASKPAKDRLAAVRFDVATVQRLVSEALGPREIAHIQHAMSLGMHVPWQEQSKQAIQNVLITARTGKAPSIDVDRLVKTTTPSKFLRSLWTELSLSAGLAEAETFRRFITFVLTTPLSSAGPPLLPIFLHTVLPSLLVSIDASQPQSHANIELLVITVSSVLTAALHLELALRGTRWEHRLVFGHPIASMARRLATDLRSANSYAGTAIVQRLSSSQSFVANFPVFMGELGV